MKKLFLISCLIFGLVACKKEEPKPQPEPQLDPTACIQSDRDYQALDQPINFKSCSLNAARVEWNFGDGGSSTITDPSHVYSKVGVYTVGLKAINGAKSADASKKIIAANKIELYCNVQWSQINLNYQQYESFNAYLYVIKNADQPQLVESTSVNVLNYTDPMTHSLTVTDVAAKYKIKLLLHKIKQGGEILQKDSVISDEISIFDGPKTPAFESKFSFITASQTLRVDYHK